MNHKEYLKNRLFHQSDFVIAGLDERRQFERLTCELMMHLDVSDLNRTRLLFQAHEFLIERGLDNGKINLILALLDGGITIIELTESLRSKLIIELNRDKESIQMDPDGDEDELYDYR